MKKITILFCFLSTIVFEANAQLNFGWAQSFNGELTNLPKVKVASDNNNSVYIVGSFKGTRSFGSISLTSNNASSTDAYIAKYNNQGICIWAKNFGGTATTNGNNVCVDGYNNVYLCGVYTDTMFVGVNYFVSNSQSSDIFIIKLDENGNVIRTKTAGGTVSDNAYAIATDVNGNLYITGSFEFKCGFDTDTVTSTGFADIFIAKYDSAGTIVWSKKAGGSGGDEVGYAIKCSASYVYVAGQITSQSMFGTHSVNPQAGDAFIAQYDFTGNNVWVKKGGGVANDDCTDLGVDSSGNVYLTGSFFQNAMFGTISLSSMTAVSVYVAKYNAVGTCLFANKIGSNGSNYDYGLAIAVDPQGYSVITGRFVGTATFYPGKTLTSSGLYDIYIARYSPTGVGKAAEKAGGLENDEGTGICWLPTHEFILVGNYKNSADFGVNTLNVLPGDDYASFVSKVPGTFTGINEINSGESISLVYPNPASYFLNVEIKANEKISVIEIKNLTGQTVIKSNESKIDTSILSDGIYSVEILTVTGRRLYSKVSVIK